MNEQRMRKMDSEPRANIIREVQRVKTKAFYEELFVFVMRHKIEYTKNNNGIFQYNAMTPKSTYGVDRIITHYETDRNYELLDDCQFGMLPHLSVDPYYG